jgi:pSer/pThr/pTyr-binding forkhead associated (FHA) protein
MAILINKTLRVEYPIQKEVVIGRSPEADLQLNFPTVSKRHVRIFEVNGVWCAEDLGSANSTYVNGERIQTKELKTGDYIRLDAYTLVFFVNAPPSLPEIIVQDPGSVIRQRLLISQPVLRIGRSLQENHIPIDDPSVSGRHLNLVRREKYWRIDFAKPGVHIRLNEKYIDSGVLISAGDKIGIGSTVLEISLQPLKEWTILSQVHTRLEEFYRSFQTQAQNLQQSLQAGTTETQLNTDWITKLPEATRIVEDSLKLLGDLTENFKIMVPDMEQLEAIEKMLEQGLRLSRRCNNLANYLELVIFNNQLMTIAKANAEQQKDYVSRLFRNIQGCLENDNPTVRL